MFPTWSEANLPVKILEAAMCVCDAVGLENFRSHWGGTFTSAGNVHVYHDNRGPYEARPLIAAAYSLRYPKANPLQPSDFQSTQAQKYLQDRGFNLKDITT